MHLAKCLEQDDWDSIQKDLDNIPVSGIDGKADRQTIIQTLKNQGISLTNQSINQSTNSNYSVTHSPSHSVTIKLWGTGEPRREFLHSNDLADACLYIMENTDFADLARYSIPDEQLNEQTKNLLTQAKEIQSSNHPIIQSYSHSSDKPDNPFHKLVSEYRVPIKNTHINIGTGKDLSIKELAELIKDVVGFRGIIDWNTNMPDGTYQKLMDVSKLHEMGWQEKIGLKEGISKVYGQYVNGKM
jgi:GDP-L-fucose synthase